MQKEWEWYLPNNDGIEPHGPFTQEQILAKLEARELGLDSFIWGVHFAQDMWMRIFELKEFESLLKIYPKVATPKRRSRGLSSTKTKSFDYKQKTGEYGEQNEYRRFPRAPMMCEIITHNQQRLTKSMTVDISEKGVSIKTEDNTMFKSGEVVTITLIDSPFLGTFSVNATVMRVLDKPFRGYGLYFLMISPQLKRKIAKYVIETLGLESEKNNEAA
ncbi:MAG: PilZ domain-containing protein [Bacteriovoracaceae bacterium]|nr:PilZ domain-containing protein [Bacteriovoracaceae bacterium]